MEGVAERPALRHVSVSMPWHRPLPPASAQTRTGVFATPNEVRGSCRGNLYRR